MREERRAAGYPQRAGVAIALTVLLGLSASALAGVDGQPAFNTAQHTGLFVWRTWHGDWQVRLLAAAAGQHVTGSFHSGQRLTSADGLAVEAEDQVRLSSERTVHFELHTARRTLDGLVLSGGTDDLCLRVDAPLPVFLGRDATPAVSPVDLTGSGACRSSLPAESDLQVFRTSAFDWRVRLVAPSQPSRFEGRIDSTLPLEGLRPFSIEAADTVRQPAPGALDVRLETWTGWHDSIEFSTPEGSRVCLRSTSGREQIVSLFNAGRVTPLRVVTPVDLTNTGGCGPPADPFPPPTYRRKFNPGHYVVLTRHDDEQSLQESIVPGVQGFSKRYTWRELEPTWGAYDFSAIAADLHLLSGHDLQLIVLIEDKTFQDELPTPDYLRSRTVPNKPGGYTVIRWDPYVVTRYKALLAALGRAFDAHPNFEGVATEESAHGIDEPILAATGYTPERYRDVLVDVLTSASRSLPRSRVFWYMNFIWEGNHYVGEIARRVSPLGVVMGGPDVMPDAFPLQRHPYPFYDGAVGHMPLFGQVEPACYHHPHTDIAFPTTFWTPEELFHYARDELHVSYMFWVRWRWRRFPDSYDWWDAVPVIGNQPTFNR